MKKKSFLKQLKFFVEVYLITPTRLSGIQSLIYVFVLLVVFFFLLLFNPPLPIILSLMSISSGMLLSRIILEEVIEKGKKKLQEKISFRNFFSFKSYLPNEKIEEVLGDLYEIENWMIKNKFSDLKIKRKLLKIKLSILFNLYLRTALNWIGEQIKVSK